jgi:phosphoribosylformylglycinamidine synthase
MALAECSFGAGAIGAEAAIEAVAVASDDRINQAAALFGESASRIIVSTAPERASEVMARAAAAHVPSRIIGRTGGSQLRIAVAGALVIDLALADLEHLWTSAIERYFVRRVA